MNNLARSIPKVRQGSSFKAFVLAGLWLLVLVYYAFTFFYLKPSRASDFAVYYTEGVALRERLNPYSPADFAAARSLSPSIPGFEVDRVTDPPTYLLLSELLALLPYSAGFWLWTAANIVAFGAGLFFLLKPLARSLNRITLWTIVALGLLYHPITSHLSFGQGKMLIFLLICLTLYMAESGREMVGAVCLALATLLRAFPIFLLGYFAFRRRWRFTLYAVGAIALGWFATMLEVGRTSSLAFFTALPYLTNPLHVGNTGNIAPSAVVERFVTAMGREHLATPYSLELLAEWMPRLLAFAFTLRLTFAVPTERDAEDRLFCLWVVTMMIMLQVEWEYDLIMLLIPFVAIAAATAKNSTSLRVVSTASVAYVLPTLEWAFRHAGATREHLLVDSIHALLVDLQVLGLAAAYLSACWFVADQPAGPLEPEQMSKPPAWRSNAFHGF